MHIRRLSATVLFLDVLLKYNGVYLVLYELLRLMSMLCLLAFGLA